VNAWINGKHGYQAAPLPGASVYVPAFLRWERAHLSA
jgi:hypothetical protein